ncbi:MULTISPECIES: sigma-70 family RNA polymerase sigma factor [Pseudoxanthomonas]|nr:sigma-70 family RNA polymerase sigma factor [Pseudoxanthomonas mexicana]MCA0297836.1 sigma-70 family RNA polymerase sigma factor [Pseudomonadota bacterium]UOV03401.1 sigma-70 family RNA polymerase sigma factor [Pseudoxanthomonas mexicana]HMM23201.1 sigma-70 family RNA polymerase sigma factor [Pseudoxanthomonas mexicana]
MLSVARARDRAAFMRLYDHFMPRLCLYLRGLGSPEAVAEELAQEALLRLWQRAAMYDPQQGAVSTWLFRIGRNLHIDRIRREPGWVQVLEEAAPASDEELARPFTSAEDYAEHVHLQRRIEDLPAVQARLMRMSYFEAKSHQEIADELQMPLGTVKSHLRRAFLRLQGQVRGQP